MPVVKLGSVTRDIPSPTDEAERQFEQAKTDLVGSLGTVYGADQSVERLAAMANVPGQLWDVATTAVARPLAWMGEHFYGPAHEAAATAVDTVFPLGDRMEAAQTVAEVLPERYAPAVYAHAANLPQTAGGVAETLVDAALDAGVGAAAHGAIPLMTRGVTPEDVVAPPWWSGGLRALEQMPASSKALPAARWEKDLLARGMTKDELKWTGTGEWLRQKGSATAEEVRDYIEKNQVRVEEVVRGEAITAEQREAAAMELYGEPFKTLPSEHKRAIDDALLRSAKHTQHSSYQLPGGENYRELLLTLPGGKSSRYEVRPQGYGFNVYDTKTGRFVESTESFEASSEFADRLNKDDATIFHTSHFPEDQNILAHVRFNDRVIDGKKTLFVEEIQSDWGQQGREKGFDISPDYHSPSEWSGPEIEEIGGETFYTYRHKHTGRRMELSSGTLSDPQDETYIKDLLKYPEQLREFVDSEMAESAVAGGGEWRGKVPTAPFVTDTNQWTKLAAQRITRWATENGYDRIAWTTGAQQTARYENDLRKAVDRIDWAGDRGKVRINASKGGQDKFINRLNLHGDTDIGGAVVSLDDVVGKKMAKQIRDDSAAGKASGSFEGDELTIGGEGMKGYYDTIVPRVFESVTGSKAGRTRLGDAGDVHYLDLTPEAKKKARQGFKLLGVGGAVGGGLALSYDELED